MGYQLILVGFKFSKLEVRRIFYDVRTGSHWYCLRSLFSGGRSKAETTSRISTGLTISWHDLWGAEGAGGDNVELHA